MGGWLWLWLAACGGPMAPPDARIPEVAPIPEVTQPIPEVTPPPIPEVTPVRPPPPAIPEVPPVRPPPPPPPSVPPGVKPDLSSPAATSCEAAADCTISCAMSCCGAPCGCRTALNVATARAAEAWGTRDCPPERDCPAVGCAYQPAMGAQCVRGVCRAIDGLGGGW